MDSARSFSALRDKPPSLRLLARELTGFVPMRLRAAIAPAVRAAQAERRSAIIVIPGFLASDRTTSRLRRSLRAAGHTVHGWGLGRNLGIAADTLDRLAAQIDAIDPGDRLTLVGWSLGGLIAREFAKCDPERVAKVVTLGSPFSGGPYANHGWRAYERIAGHSVDAPPIVTRLSQKPPVPTIAIWSPLDGIVATRSARGRREESDIRLRVDCTHMGLVADPRAIHAVAEAVGA